MSRQQMVTMIIMTTQLMSWKTFGGTCQLHWHVRRYFYNQLFNSLQLYLDILFFSCFLDQIITQYFYDGLSQCLALHR